MAVSFLKRLKGKSVRDFVVYFRRKYFLGYVKFCNRILGPNYFFSKAYFSKYLYADYQEQNKLVDAKFGILGCKIELKQRLSHWRLQFSNEFQLVVDQANKFLAHDFDLLGSGSLNLSFPCRPTGVQGIKYNFEPIGEPSKATFLPDSYQCIDWHVDFRSGYRWDPSKYYPSSRKYTEVKGADIKLPWELSRCQHLPMLSIAFLLTDKKEYALEVYHQITDWIINNPLCMGPNWNCPMDVAIRVANWFVSLEILEGFIPPDYEKYQQLILASFVQHFDYLKNNFEWTSKLTSNHYLSDIAGFAFCTQYIPHLKSRTKFAEFAKKELQTELAKQMYEDGMNAEGSLYYHRLVLELFSYSSCLQANRFLSDQSGFNNHLRQCFEFTKDVIRPDNRMPQIGDNDSGLFLNLTGVGLDDLNYLFVLGARLFPGSGYERLIDPNSLAATILNVTPIRNAVADTVKTVSCFKQSGLAVIKTDSMYLSFYCGLNGQKGNGGHCHNDRLSFTLWRNGREIFTDPGTGFYTAFPKLRNSFRSTSAHNTVSISNLEQNRFIKNNLFSLKEDIRNVDLTVMSNTECIELTARHDGFTHISGEMIHRRHVKVHPKGLSIEITDEIGSGKGTAFFILLKGYKFVVTDQYFESDFASIFFEGASRLECKDYMYSDGYGHLNADKYQQLSVHFSSQLISRISLK